MQTQIDTLLDAMRAEARRQKLKKCELAERAGLHVNTLRRFYEPVWSPTVETIRALENVLLTHSSATHS